MAIYNVETEGGTYQVHTEEPAVSTVKAMPGVEGLNPDKGASIDDLSKDTVGNDALGESRPIEQRLAENAVAAGNGIGMGTGVGGLMEAGAGLLNKAASALPSEGVMGTVGQYAKRFGQNQAMKSLGASSGQIGQVGIPESRAIAQDMIDKGVISPLRGPIGLEEKVHQLHGQAGQAIGDLRASADKAGQAPQMSEILQQVKQNLEGKYASGADKGMAGLNRAREEIAKGGTGTFVGNAQKATDLNTSAAANKVYRPQTASTDVADTISHMNNEGMSKVLTPAENIQYTQAKTDYGNLDKVKQFLERGERREMGGRGGAATVGKALADQTMDMLGNRTAAIAGSHLGDVLNTAGKFEKPGAKSLAAYLMEKDLEDKNRGE